MRSPWVSFPTGCAVSARSARAWPANDFQPSRAERIALQRRLAELGYKVADFNGHLDFDLRDDVREMQRQFGMVPDGYPGRALLLRIGVPAR